MRVALVAKPGHASTGVGRYVEMLQAGLSALGGEVAQVAPTLPALPPAVYAGLRRAGVDLRAFLTNYPVSAAYPAADVYHFTSQNLATLLHFGRPPGRVVVTVHDIIPYVLRHDPALCSYRTPADRLFDRLAMAGLRRADLLIADSQYTKRAVVEHLRIAPERIEVVYLGVDRERFRPLAESEAVRRRYGLPEGRRYLIYVGSEDPRKNLANLVRALAVLRREAPDVELIKVGRAHFDHERRRLVELALSLGVLSSIVFLDDVPEADLPHLYNLADVCVMPSLYEGFGFPVLEAMACGTPVVCSDAASLPELAGDAGVVVGCAGTGGVASLAGALRDLLRDADRRAVLRARGLARASQFRWSDTARAIANLYGGASRPAASARRAVVRDSLGGPVDTIGGAR